MQLNQTYNIVKADAPQCIEFCLVSNPTASATNTCRMDTCCLVGYYPSPHSMLKKNPPFHTENTKFCGLVDIAKGESGKRRQGVPRLLAEALTQP